jgi:hypothetical protein
MRLWTPRSSRQGASPATHRNLPHSGAGDRHQTGPAFSPVTDASTPHRERLSEGRDRTSGPRLPFRAIGTVRKVETRRAARKSIRTAEHRCRSMSRSPAMSVAQRAGCAAALSSTPAFSWRATRCGDIAARPTIAARACGHRSRVSNHAHPSLRAERTRSAWSLTCGHGQTAERVEHERSNQTCSSFQSRKTALVVLVRVTLHHVRNRCTACESIRLLPPVGFEHSGNRPRLADLVGCGVQVAEHVKYLVAKPPDVARGRLWLSVALRKHDSRVRVRKCKPGAWG